MSYSKHFKQILKDFRHTKGVSRSRKSEDRQYNAQKKKDNNTNQGSVGVGVYRKVGVGGTSFKSGLESGMGGTSFKSGLESGGGKQCK